MSGERLLITKSTIESGQDPQEFSHDKPKGPLVLRVCRLFRPSGTKSCPLLSGACPRACPMVAAGMEVVAVRELRETQGRKSWHFSKKLFLWPIFASQYAARRTPRRSDIGWLLLKWLSPASNIKERTVAYLSMRC